MGADDEKKDSGKKQNAETTEEDKVGFGEMMQNFAESTGLCCFKAKEHAIISKLEFQIQRRQEKFGVDYMNLVEKRAPKEELNDCLKVALRDIHDMQQEIDDHHDRMDDKEEEVTAKKAERENVKPKKQKQPPSSKG